MQFDQPNRRELITSLAGAAAARPLVGGAMVAWPRKAWAQQSPLPIVGFLRSTPLAPFQSLVTKFGEGLKETGFVDGQNVKIAYRYGDDHFDRLPRLITELLEQGVAVIVANGSAAIAASHMSKTVPIVFAFGNDPVANGLVTNYNRPGGNITGIVFFSSLLGGKRFELLCKLVPTATRIAALISSHGAYLPNVEQERMDIRAAAQSMARTLIEVDVQPAHEDIDAAFARFAEQKAEALFVGAGPFLNSRREYIVALAARYALPAIYGNREAVLAGGLLGYSASQPTAYREAGIYAGRILKGEKPGDLPVVQSITVDLVLNLRTAKALGLEIPPTLLALADEVIE